MNDLYTLTLHEALTKLNRKEISSLKLTQNILERIEAVDKDIQAYISVHPEQAITMAQRADERRRRGETAPLLGLPVGLKDSITTKGVTTTCGSLVLKNYIPPFEATVAKKLREAGAVFLGKTNTDEFTMGSSTEFSAFKPSRNPWNLACVPGGSSGGSSAAIAANAAIATLGTDTGGSVRQPASFCGVVGLKPTYGRVSRYGLIAHGSSFDQIGPITKTVQDAAILLQVIAGSDPLDSTTLNYDVPDYISALDESRGFQGLKIGIPKEYFPENVLESGVEMAIREALQVAQKAGAELIDVSLAHTDYGIAAYYLIVTAEASSNLARYDGVRYGLRVEAKDMISSFVQTRSAGFGPEVKRRIMLGTYALSAGYYDAYYLKAQKVRTLVRQDFEKVFKEVDVLFSPTAPSVAFQAGQKIDDPLQMYLSDIFTVPASLAGICGLSIPCGFSNGLPVGLQILGPALGESLVLQVGHAFQKETDWHKQQAVIA